MKILVTGGAGFIGSHLTDSLIKEGYSVVVVDNFLTGKKENLNSKSKLYKIDICNPRIKDIFNKEKPQAVFHFAAQINLRKSVEDPIRDAKTNILGSINILENCKDFKVKKIIFSSSGGAIYGDATIIPTPESYSEHPLSPYGIDKLIIDKYLNYYYKVFGLPYISLRLANVYGPRQNSKGEAGVIAIFAEKILKGIQPIINGSGKQTRDFVYVEDVVKAALLALEKNKIGIFNIGTANETNMNIIFKKIKKQMNSAFKEVHGPEKIGEQKKSCLNFSKAKKQLGWKPYFNLDQGLKKTIEHLKN
jgi:UDP-glucose 4-epimerase